jgi:hypothetical protein
MSSQPTSSMTENDLKLEWLLCLASTLEASRRQPIRAQAEESIATRPRAIKTKHNPHFERLLFLTSELQASRYLRTSEGGEAGRRPGFAAGATSLAGA